MTSATYITLSHSISPTFSCHRCRSASLVKCTRSQRIVQTFKQQDMWNNSIHKFKVKTVSPTSHGIISEGKSHFRLLWKNSRDTWPEPEERMPPSPPVPRPSVAAPALKVRSSWLNAAISCRKFWKVSSAFQQRVQIGRQSSHQLSETRCLVIFWERHLRMSSNLYLSLKA